MKIMNRTHWKTANLRAFVSHVAAEELEAPARKTLVVVFDYMDHSRHGYARVLPPFGSKITFRLPKNNSIDKPYFGICLAWAMAKTRGVSEEMLRGSRYHCTGNWLQLYEWTRSLPLDVQAPKPAKPKPTKTERQGFKIVLARKSVKHWQTVAKRAATYLKKWERRLAALERAAEARRREAEVQEKTLDQMRENLLEERGAATPGPESGTRPEP